MESCNEVRLDYRCPRVFRRSEQCRRRSVWQQEQLLRSRAFVLCSGPDLCRSCGLCPDVCGSCRVRPDLCGSCRLCPGSGRSQLLCSGPDLLQSLQHLLPRSEEVAPRHARQDQAALAEEEPLLRSGQLLQRRADLCRSGRLCPDLRRPGRLCPDVCRSGRWLLPLS